MGRQVNRRAATKKAVFRRLRDAELSRLPDRRDRRGRRHSYLGLVYALMLGCVSALRSLRDVERQSDELSVDLRQTTGIRQRISDTTLRDTLLALEPSELRPALHRQVKAEHRRGNLKPVRLPIGHGCQQLPSTASAWPSWTAGATRTSNRSGPMAVRRTGWRGFTALTSCRRWQLYASTGAVSPGPPTRWARSATSPASC